MNTSHRILLFALALPFAGPALAETPAQGDDNAEQMGELQTRLDSFVQDAISEGLLTPARPAQSSVAEETLAPVPAAPVIEQPDIEEARSEAVPALSLKPLTATYECTASNPLDFSAYSDLTSYDDLLNWRKSLDIESSDDNHARLAGAYLTFGLNEEARMQLVGVQDGEAAALRRFAHLMEARNAPDIEFFQAFAECHEDAAIWHATALLVTSQPDGADRLEAHIADYAALPLQLRTEVAALAVPVLDRMGKTTLAEKLMTAFSAKEVDSSSRLKFNRLILDMHVDIEASEPALRQYLFDPQYRMDAVRALMMHRLPIERELEDEMVRAVVDEVRRRPEDLPVADSLDTLLQDLNDTAGYAMTLQLASLPAAQTGEARDKLALHLVSLLDRDAASEDALSNLTAMRGVAEGASLLEGRSERERLLGAATSIAVKFGFQSLADSYAADMEHDESVALSLAALAFRLENDDRVFRLAARSPQNQGINRFAAFSAIRQNDRAKLVQSIARLDLDSGTIVDLMEFDAARGQWILPAAVYEAATQIRDETYRARAERVLSLRAGSQSAPRPVQRYEVTQVPSNLQRISLSLRPQDGETY